MSDIAMSQISEDEFCEVFSPIETSPEGDCIVDRYSDAQSIARDKGFGDNHIWAIMDGDSGGSMYANPGYHVVNTLGFVITEKPWETGNEEALWYECENEDDEDDEDWTD